MANTDLSRFSRWIARAVLVMFGLWTAWIVLEHGYTGFLTLAWAEAWAGQMFVDLVIALSLFLIWMFGDAKRRGIVAWPFVLLTLFTGSIGPLLYIGLYGVGEGQSSGSRVE